MGWKSDGHSRNPPEPSFMLVGMKTSATIREIGMEVYQKTKNSLTL
jgi:hypothetical protein